MSVTIAILASMTFTLGSVLYLFWGFLACFTILALMAIWHMVKYGTYGGRNYGALFLFLAGTAVVLWGTFTLLDGTNWSRPILAGLQFGGMTKGIAL